MNRNVALSTLAVGLACMLAVMPAFGALVVSGGFFSDDFNDYPVGDFLTNNTLDWRGKLLSDCGTNQECIDRVAPPSGFIVDDPLASGRGRVLTFRGLTGYGDIFTTQGISSPTGEFILRFDYLGLNAGPGVDGDLGGFVGYSSEFAANDSTSNGFPSFHIWLAGTQPTSFVLMELVDDGAWGSYAIQFTMNSGLPAGTPIHLMLEDFDSSFGAFGDAYFDNVVLAAVPIPASFPLLAAALAILFAINRRVRL